MASSCTRTRPSTTGPGPSSSPCLRPARSRRGRRADTAAVAVAPLAGITALTAMDALQLSEGETVLIVGATGGVGSFAVQLAADAGATVLAPALPEDEDYLRGLGVAEVLDREA